MDPLSWALFALAAAAAFAVVYHLYRHREMPGQGRLLLAGMRWAALAILILLLFDPELPAPGLAAGGARTWVLVDASLSMALPVEAGDTTTRWARATAEAARLARRGGEVLLFGGSPERVAVDSLAMRRPRHSTSRLLPALQAASESGAARAIVLTDGGLEDAAEVERLLPRLGLDVEVRPIGSGPGWNHALAELDAPAWAEAGKPVQIRVGVVGAGSGGPDSVTVEVRRDGEPVAAATVGSPAEGRVAGAVLEFTPEAASNGGAVRYDVALVAAEPDAVADDDERSVYIRVGERPAGVALVSFRPDWEPRFLHPILEQTLGLPVHGFLRTADGRYVRVAAGRAAGRPADEAEVRRAVDEATLVVLHGYGADAPGWAAEVARDGARVLIFPAAGEPGPGLPVRLTAPAQGEWFALADVPASPVAPLLATLRTDELPPLSGVRSAERGAGSWAPLVASRGRRGEPAPVVVAAEHGGRRFAVATADGYWRWAFRGGEPRQAYRRLWGSIAGWLAGDADANDGAAVRPARPTVARAEPIAWVAPGLGADSVALRIVDAVGGPVVDTTVARARGDTVVTSALEPGHYRYEAVAYPAEGGAPVAAEGEFTVESYSPEFVRAAADVARLAAVGDGARRRPGGRVPGEPLHTMPWPYLLLAALVSTEWVLRRRWGLR